MRFFFIMAATVLFVTASLVDQSSVAQSWEGNQNPTSPPSPSSSSLRSSDVQATAAAAHEKLAKPDPQETVAMLEQLVAAGKGSLPGLKPELGIASHPTGKLISAEKVLAQALAADPSDTKLVEMQGLTLDRRGPLPGQTDLHATTTDANLESILTYIHSAWDSLTRSTTTCSGISDPKLHAAPVLYLPSGFNEPAPVERMQRECAVRVVSLPPITNKAGSGELDRIEPPGLLYLENPYVVPGGRFNEMYGWDSYFIIRGLLHDGRLDLARGMVDNFFFEIEHYGAVLNANRTYYLTRSQPPFLSSMVMAVDEAQNAAGKRDRAWLEKAYEYVKRDHAMWTEDAHLAGTTGLSRYYDFGEGPAIEALKDENDIYRQAAAYFLFHPATPPLAALEAEVTAGRASGAPYSVRVCSAAQSQSCEPERRIKLEPDYYKGDRSMRESGFDISFRFGPFGALTHHYAPVCLNSLLFKTERDLETMSRILGNNAQAAHWQALAQARKVAVEKYLWDARQGLFFDYNFESGQQSDYRYATTFYPLWVGLATDEQAQGVMKNLHLFEQPGGLAMSLRASQGQWDYPFGWAPIQLLAIEGMRRYGYNPDADRVSSEFLSTVLENFARDKTIREKYNVVTRSSVTGVTAGYSANVIGFGWTNATFLVLLDSLPPEKAHPGLLPPAK